MNITRFIVSASVVALTSLCAPADSLIGNGSWQSWSPTVLNSATSGAPTGPYWNGASGDGANYNIGWCLTGTGSCHIAGTPGALSYYGNGNASANMSFTSLGLAQEVSLLGLFSNQNGNPPSGTDYFGWYSISTMGAVGPLNQLLNSNQPIGTSATFNPTGNYGFYFENVQSAGTSFTASYYWLSTVTQSYATGTGIVDTGTQHIAAFGSATSSTYFFGLEDTPSPNSDFDFNDMIVELQPAPEPASIALMLGGLSLFGLVIRRRA